MRADSPGIVLNGLPNDGRSRASAVIVAEVNVPDAKLLAETLDAVVWDKKACKYLGLLMLACALLWYRRYHRLTRQPRS